MKIYDNNILDYILTGIYCFGSKTLMESISSHTNLELKQKESSLELERKNSTKITPTQIAPVKTNTASKIGRFVSRTEFSSTVANFVQKCAQQDVLSCTMLKLY